MTTLNSNVTPANYAEVLRLAEQALEPAREKRDRLKAVFERRTAPRSEFETDPALYSGIRRRTTAYQAKREQATFDRDMAAYKAYQAAEKAFTSLEGRVRVLRASAPVPYTEDQLRAAKAVRTEVGWYRLLKVNRVTVGVDAGDPWPLKVPRTEILEVR